MYEIEESVKKLIVESLNKRIVDIERVDNLCSNDTIVKRWLTDIMALGYNENDIELAAQDILEIGNPFETQSIEDLRGRLFLSQNRFCDEILAFQAYVNDRDHLDDEALLEHVREELADVEEGEFMLS